MKAMYLLLILSPDDKYSIVCAEHATDLFTDVLPWQRVLRSKVVLEYILVEFANMEEIFQSLMKSKDKSNNCWMFLFLQVYQQHSECFAT